MDADYKQILEAVKADLKTKRDQLALFLGHVEKLEDDIRNLELSAVALSRVVGESFRPQDEVGITDAIRNVFRNGENFTATEVRDELKNVGFPVGEYENVLASVHAVIKRLLAKDEIKPIGNRADGKPAYAWALPKPQPLLPNVAELFVPFYGAHQRKGAADLLVKKLADKPKKS